MTKNTPKKPAVTVRAINFPASRLGELEKRSSAYIAGIAETKRMPRPPAAVDFGSGIRFRNHRLEVLTGGRGLDSTILLRSERTTQKPTKKSAFWDGFGHWFENSITKDGLEHVEVNEHQETDASKEY